MQSVEDAGIVRRSHGSWVTSVDLSVNLSYSKPFLFAQRTTVTSRMSDPISERALYIIHCLDDISGEMIDKGARFGGSAKRFSVYADHKAYLGETSDPSSPKFIHKIAAGPIESDDKKYMIGSFFIVEATKEEAENFNRNDPFFVNQVWDRVSLLPCCGFYSPLS